MAFLIHVLRSEDLFGDIGADTGTFSILAAKNAGASVIAVEAIPSTVEKLRENIVLNDVSNSVNVLPYVVGNNNAPKTIWFSQNMDHSNRIFRVNELFERKIMVEIPVKTIDELFKEKTPVVIKIDIRGFEWPALNGALNIISLHL